MRAARLTFTFGPPPGRSYPLGCCGLVGCSGGVVDILLLSSGRDEAWHVDDLELETVGIVKEECVVPGDVGVLLRVALDLDPLSSNPLGPFVHLGPRVRLEREVMQSDPVAVVRLRIRQRLAQADGGPRAGDVPDRLAALTFDLGDRVEAERAEQLRVEGQTALDRGDDEVEVMNARGAQGWRFSGSARSGQILCPAVAHGTAHRPL